MIVTACACLHKYIRDSNLRDEHFDTFESGGYVEEESASHPSVAPVDDGSMGTVRDAIATSVVPWWLVAIKYDVINVIAIVGKKTL